MTVPNFTKPTTPLNINTKSNKILNRFKKSLVNNSSRNNKNSTLKLFNYTPNKTINLDLAASSEYLKVIKK